MAAIGNSLPTLRSRNVSCNYRAQRPYQPVRRWADSADARVADLAARMSACGPGLELVTRIGMVARPIRDRYQLSPSRTRPGARPGPPIRAARTAAPRQARPRPGHRSRPGPSGASRSPDPGLPRSLEQVVVDGRARHQQLGEQFAAGPAGWRWLRGGALVHSAEKIHSRGSLRGRRPAAASGSRPGADELARGRCSPGPALARRAVAGWRHGRAVVRPGIARRPIGGHGDVSASPGPPPGMTLTVGRGCCRFAAGRQPASDAVAIPADLGTRLL